MLALEVLRLALPQTLRNLNKITCWFSALLHFRVCFLDLQIPSKSYTHNPSPPKQDRKTLHFQCSVRGYQKLDALEWENVALWYWDRLRCTRECRCERELFCSSRLPLFSCSDHRSRRRHRESLLIWGEVAALLWFGFLRSGLAMSHRLISNESSALASSISGTTGEFHQSSFKANPLLLWDTHPTHHFPEFKSYRHSLKK